MGRGVKVVLLCEDTRQEMFFKRILVGLGVHPRAVTVRKAPASSGSAEAWVREQFAAEVRKIRSRHVNAALIAVRDGDHIGVAGRKKELADRLAAAGLPDRGPAEAICLPVPTWSIETWLLMLVGEALPTDAEAVSLKHQWERSFTGKERHAMDTAAGAFTSGACSGEPPSLTDGRAELARLL